MPELVEPLIGTADLELLSQGAEAVRPTILPAHNISRVAFADVRCLCSECGKGAFWANLS